MDEQNAADFLARLGIRGPHGESLTAAQAAGLLSVLGPLLHQVQQPGPPDPAGSPLFATAVGLHEFFRVLCAAGFAEDQALRFLAYASQAHQPPS